MASWEEMISSLEKVGLTKIEARVYMVLLKHGSVKAGKIAKEANLNRTTTYDALKRLLEKGLASYVVQENRKYFQPVEPQRLVEFIKEKENEARSIMPDLSKLLKISKEPAHVKLYYGSKGIKSVFMDFIKSGGPIRVLDSEGQFIEVMPDFAKYYIKQIEKKKIKIYHIVREGRDIKPSKTTEVRYVKKSPSNSSMDIYGNKICIIVWSDPPEAVVIESKSTAESMRFYFDMLWKMSKK